MKRKNGACKVTEIRGNKHPYITQDGQDRECNPQQYIANMRNYSVAGFKYFDVTDKNVCLFVKICSYNGKVAKGNCRLQITMIS